MSNVYLIMQFLGFFKSKKNSIYKTLQYEVMFKNRIVLYKQSSENDLYLFNLVFFVLKIELLSLDFNPEI